MTPKLGQDDLSHIEPGSLEIVWGKASVKYGDLQSRVKAVIDKASWWDRWGEDCSIMASSVLLVLPLSLWLMSSENPVTFMTGALGMGYLHGMAIVKVAHSFSHSSMGFSARVTELVQWLSTELIGAFPVDVACDGHVKVHHPHTNIIGLGDSSTWRAPALSRSVYLFLAPLLLPVATPFLGIAELIRLGRPLRAVRFVGTAGLGLAAQWALYHYAAGLGGGSALFWCAGTRALFMPTYIHVNIFQHIGLSMYSTENRPDRCSQMSYGVLNLHRHPVLDLNFGHSIISCHVEHHLFPRLSDKLCLLVQPTVRAFCKEQGLPYFRKTYANRLNLFFRKYEELMVDAPPVTKFVAVQ